MVVSGFQQLENLGRHQVWWNSVKLQAWQQRLVSPCPSRKCSPQTLHVHLPPRSCLLQAWHAWMCTAARHLDVQLSICQIWGLEPRMLNKHSWTVNIWLHVHMITSKQICSKYLFFLLHCTLHWKSNSFSSDDMNIKYACVFYFSGTPLTAFFFLFTQCLSSTLCPLWSSESCTSHRNIHLNCII